MMNKTIKHIGSALLLTATLMVVGSCANDEFLGEGTGTLRMRLTLNSDLTRAQVDNSSLSESCVIYISNSQGLIHKFRGLENVPASIPLKVGSYTAEAWAGDSVSASFDKKFYKTYQPFTIKEGENSLVLNCKIANVVATVMPESINSELLKNWKITVSNTRGSLDFTQDNIASAHGYFMQPNGDTKLTWTLTADDPGNLGAPLSVSGEIENVQPAHEYILKAKYGEADTSNIGGAFVTIEVDDTEIVLDKVIQVNAAPQIAGVGFDIDNGLAGEDGSFEDVYVGVSAYQAIESCVVSFDDAAKAAFGISFSSVDLKGSESAKLQSLANAGFSWADTVKDGFEYINFNISAGTMNALAIGNYGMAFEVTDRSGRTRHKEMPIEISRAPIRTLNVDQATISQHKVTLAATILNDDASEYGVKFRERGTTEWTTLTSTRTRATEISFDVEGLKPNTIYEWCAYADDFITAIKTFKTVAAYEIFNASFEEWGLNSDHEKNTVFPGPGTVRTYWDSGNHGSNKMSVTLTDKSTDMVHSGTYSAKLRSQFVGLGGSLGKFAAGNIFIGEFAGTDGTDGILKLGRPFDGSHPVALEVYANYRPGAVTKTSSNSACPLKMGENDHAQIYVALSTEIIEVRTKNQSKLFNPDDNAIIAYGQVTWTDNFGPDGQLARLRIPIAWKSGREKEKPAYLIVVCSASKYGDYFAGGEGSTMYVDDFRVVYDGE